MKDYQVTLKEGTKDSQKYFLQGKKYVDFGILERPNITDRRISNFGNSILKKVVNTKCVLSCAFSSI